MAGVNGGSGGSSGSDASTSGGSGGSGSDSRYLDSGATFVSEWENNGDGYINLKFHTEHPFLASLEQKQLQMLFLARRQIH